MNGVRDSRLLDHPGSPPLTQTTFLACCAHYPGGPIGADGYSLARSRAGFFPTGSAFPHPARVGVHIAAFEACSSFTRVTACQVARPPNVDFVARFQPDRFPSLTARQLSNLTINCSSGSFPHW